MKKSLKTFFISCIISAATISIPIIASLNVGVYKNNHNIKMNSWNQSITKHDYSSSTQDNYKKLVIKKTLSLYDISSAENEMIRLPNNGDIYMANSSGLWKKEGNDIKLVWQQDPDKFYDFGNVTMTPDYDNNIYLSFYNAPDTSYPGSKLITYNTKTGEYLKPLNPGLKNIPKDIRAGRPFITKNFETNQLQTFLPMGDTIEKISFNAVPKRGSFAKNTFDHLAVMNKWNDQLYILTRYGLFRSAGTEDYNYKKLTLINSDIKAVDKASYIKVINGEMYLRGSYKGGVNKLFWVNKETGFVEEVSKGKMNNVGGFVRIKNGQFVITDKTGIYTNKQKLGFLTENTKWTKIADGDFSNATKLLLTKNQEGFYFTGKNKFGDNIEALYTTTSEPNPDSKILWEWAKPHRNDDKSGYMLINNNIHQHGSLLQYKNGNNWKFVPENRKMLIHTGVIRFRWVPDTLNKFMKFNLGDGSGKTRTQEQLDWFKNNVKAAPGGVELGNKVTQANIDKRNGVTLTGKPVIFDGRSKITELFHQSEFGIDDDVGNLHNAVSTNQNIEFKKDFSPEYIENGNSLNFESEIWISLTNKHHPSLKDIREHALHNGNKNQKFKITMNITYKKDINKFYFKLSKKDMSSNLISNNVFLPFLIDFNQTRRLGFVGKNLDKNEIEAGWSIWIEKNGNIFTVHLKPYSSNPIGEDAIYYSNTKILSAKFNTQNSLTPEQIAAANAKFKAREGDKLGHIYTKSEIWIRDYGTDMNVNTILGFNSKDIFVLNIEGIIHFDSWTYINPKNVEKRINSFLYSEDNPILGPKNYWDGEIKATNEVLGLDPELFEVVPNQTLKNGMNKITIKTRNDKHVFWSDNSDTRDFNIDIKNKFFYPTQNYLQDVSIFHNKSEEFEVTDSMLGIMKDTHITVYSGQKVKWGLNQIKLYAKSGYLFENKKNYIIISLTVFQYSEKETENAVQILKDQLKNITLVNQGFIKVSQIAYEINNANSLKEKLELIRKWTNITIKALSGNTNIVNIITKSNGQGELDLLFVTYSKNTIVSVHNFHKKLQGIKDTTISNYVQKNDNKKINELLSSAELKPKKQGYRLLSDIATTIIDSDSLFNILGLEPIKLKDSIFTSVSAKANKEGDLTVDIILSTFGATNPETNISKLFIGNKTDLEINGISVSTINLAQKHDIKNIYSQLSNSQLQFDKYETAEELKVASRKVTDVAKLKKTFGIDLNIDLQASIIKQVEADPNSSGNIVVKVHVRSYRANDSKVVITKEYKNIFNPESSIIKNLPAIIIVSIVVTLMVITGLITIRIKSNKKMLY